MSKVVLAAGILWISIACAMAQVSVELLLDQEQFLRDESLPVKVRIGNRSGQTLRLGQETNWLSFSIQRREGNIVPKLGDPPVGGEFTLDSAMAATRTVDLMPYFDLGQPGRYLVTVTVKLKQWNREESSAPKTFEIIPGTKLWEQEFGVPTSSGAPEVRKYTLQQARYLKQLMLYVRLTDPSETTIFRVLPVGRLLSFSHPEAQVDRLSQLHLLFQIGARAFQYLVITPDGQVVVRQTHEYTSTRPVLRGGEDGRILVNGGRRRFGPEDLPPPSSAATETNEVSTPKP